MATMTQRTVVFLKEPAGAPSLGEEEQAAVQDQHLAYLGSMREQGFMLTAGPFRKQADESLRGMCIYHTGLVETRVLAEADPAVRAGLLSVEAMEWHFPEADLPG